MRDLTTEDIRTSNPKAKEIFIRTIKGKNLITPDVLGYGVRGIFAYELSEGTGFGTNPLYGVTVLELTGERRNDLSQMFHSIEEADEYIKKLPEFKSVRVNE
jgi:hypothetical protein